MGTFDGISVDWVLCLRHARRVAELGEDDSDEEEAEKREEEEYLFEGLLLLEYDEERSDDSVGVNG